MLEPVSMARNLHFHKGVSHNPKNPTKKTYSAYSPPKSTPSIRWSNPEKYDKNGTFGVLTLLI
jgi:hypothetical protein